MRRLDQTARHVFGHPPANGGVRQSRVVRGRCRCGRRACSRPRAAATWRSTSCAVIRPSWPVPWTSAADDACSLSSRRTAGLSCLPGASLSADTAAAGASRSGDAGRPGSRGAAAATAKLRRASTSSGFTSSFASLRTSTKVPLAGAGISTVTLSVSSSTKGSSLTTASPTCLHQRRTVARVPSSLGGTNTSASRVISDFSQGFDGVRNSLGVRQDFVEQYRTVGAG